MENNQILSNANDNPMLFGVRGKSFINIDDNLIAEAIICCFYKQGLLTEKEYVHIMDGLTAGTAM